MVKNLTIVCNGLSGSGKTTAIYGNDASNCIIFSCLEELFPEGQDKKYFLSIR
jgi:hypothetical protein